MNLIEIDTLTMTSHIAHASYVCYHFLPFQTVHQQNNANHSKTQDFHPLETYASCAVSYSASAGGLWFRIDRLGKNLSVSCLSVNLGPWTQASLSLSIWPLLRVCPGLSPHQFSTQVDSDSSISSTVQVLLRYRWKCTDMWCEIFFRHSGGRGGWESAFSWEKIILLVMTWNYSLIRPDQLLPSTRIAVVQLNTKFWLGMLQYFLPWGKGKKILQDREPKARVEFCLTAMLYCGTASTGEPSALWESMARWRKMPKQLLSSEVPGPPAWERKSMEKHQGKDLRVKRSSDSCSLSTWLQDALGKLHIHTYPSMYL